MTDRERDIRLIERAEYAAAIEEAGAVRYRSHANDAGDSMTRTRMERRADQRELNAQRAREIAEEARARLRAMPRPDTPRANCHWCDGTGRIVFGAVIRAGDTRTNGQGCWCMEQRTPLFVTALRRWKDQTCDR